MQSVAPNPNLVGAVLMAASLVKAGDEVCFRWPGANYIVDEVETDSIGHVRHRMNDCTASCSYHPGELLWVKRAGKRIER